MPDDLPAATRARLEQAARALQQMTPSAELARDLLVLLACHDALHAAQAHLDGQIDKLANYIMQECPGEPSRSEGAVDTAIRLLAAQALATSGTGTYCAYCTAEFPDEQPDTVEQIQRHVYECPFHPMRAVERDRDQMDSQATRYRVALEKAEAAQAQATPVLAAVDAWKLSGTVESVIALGDAYATWRAAREE